MLNGVVFVPQSACDVMCFGTGGAGGMRVKQNFDRARPLRLARGQIVGFRQKSLTNERQ